METSPLAVLLDPNRLRIAGALVGRQLSTDAVVDCTGIDRRVALEAIGELRQCGLVEQRDGMFTLTSERLRRFAAEIAVPEVPMDPTIGHGMGDDERDVLARFFAGRRLVELPIARAKRLVVLERLALEFEPGRRYDEVTVNGILAEFHPDVATLRRQLVDEDFLDRATGEYWRSGGRT